MIDEIAANAPLYLLLAARCFALLMTLPLFSMRSVPRTAKVALAGYMAFLIMPQADFSSYNGFVSAAGEFNLTYVLLLVGEAMIGIIMGLYVTVIFAAFSTAGQFVAFQMGLSASEVYDSLSQVENPLMGQFFNLVAMLVFLQSGWFQKLFIKGLASSVSYLNVFGLIEKKEEFVMFLVRGLTELFSSALVISLPIMGTLLLVSVSMGILSRAAPQMNMLSEGFAIMLLTAYFVMAAIMPALIEFFVNSFNLGMANIANLVGGGT